MLEAGKNLEKAGAELTYLILSRGMRSRCACIISYTLTTLTAVMLYVLKKKKKKKHKKKGGVGTQCWSWASTECMYSECRVPIAVPTGSWLHDANRGHLEVTTAMC